MGVLCDVRAEYINVMQVFARSLSKKSLTIYRSATNFEFFSSVSRRFLLLLSYCFQWYYFRNKSLDLLELLGSDYIVSLAATHNIRCLQFQRYLTCL